MPKTKIVLNSAGVREMLKGPDMQALLLERAQAISERAGSGYETDVFVGRNRANASVFASDPEAVKDNMKNNTLLKALG